MSKIRILHKSPQFLVIDKPFDLVMNHDDPQRDSVHLRLQKELPETVNPKLKHGYFVSHRLDYSTSGALLVPLTKQATRQACRAFELRITQKYYLALLRGKCAQDFYHVSLAIGMDSRTEMNSLRAASADSEFCVKPKSAETLITVLSRGTFQGDPATKVIMKPLTGRTHQLRIHCHSLGHTIVGDYVYSDKKDADTERMYLHAYKLQVPMPLEILDIDAQDPFHLIQDYKVEEMVTEMDHYQKTVIDPAFNLEKLEMQYQAKKHTLGKTKKQEFQTWTGPV